MVMQLINITALKRLIFIGICGLLVGCEPNGIEVDIEKQWALENDGIMRNMAIDQKNCSIPRSHIKKDIDIDALEMWELLEDMSLEKTIVAIIDSGVNYENEELGRHRWDNPREVKENNIDDDGNGYIDDECGVDFVRERGILSNEEYTHSEHGTACAGIICADTRNGVADVANNCPVEIMSLRVFDPTAKESENDVNDIISAIHYAEENGARICNMSFGMGMYSEGLRKCMEESEMLFICSAGNSNGTFQKNIDKERYYPASFDLANMITVANVGFDGRLYYTSNYGPDSVDVVAPGVNIYVMSGNEEYSYQTGTSFAVSYVSGIAALLLSVDSGLRSNELKQSGK